MKFSSPLLLSAISMAFSVPAFAEEQSPIIVTATRTAQTADDSLASVTVITEKDIQQSQSKSLPELLNQVAGIDFANNGGYGKESSMYFRGTNPSHVLVLIDGVKIGSATSGKISSQYLPLSHIERIEIVRGARSSLYGSEAVGGVIQIFTRQGKDKTTTNASIGFGSDNTRSASAGISGGSKKTKYNINVEYFNTDGFHIRDGKNPDNDGFENSSASIGASHSFSKDTKLSLSVLHAEGKNEYDGSTSTSTYHSDFLQQTIAAKLTTNATKTWEMIFGINQARDESDEFKDNVFTDKYNTERNSIIWQNNITINEENILTLGLDYLDDKIDSSRTFSKTSRDNTGLYAQYQLYGENNDFLIGLRNDDNEAFGNNATGNVSWANNLSKDLRIRASYGTAFKAPTFNQLYHPTVGDPSILPEESDNIELGIEGKLNKGKWEINLYQNKITNLIEYNFGTSKFENISKAEINGLEAIIASTVANWDIKASLSLLDPKNSDTDKYLRRRSTQIINLSLDKQFGNFHLGADLTGKNRRFHNASNTNRLSGYGIVNLRASYSFNEKWKLNAKIDNLFDKEYETIDSYNMPELSAFVSIQYFGE